MLNSSGRLRIVSDTGWLPSVATALAIADGYVGYGIQYGQDYYNKLVRSSCRRKYLGFFGRERRRKRIVMLAAGDGVRKARTHTFALSKVPVRHETNNSSGSLDD